MEKLGKVTLNNNERRIKVKLENKEWDIVIADKTILFDAVCDLVFDSRSLYYYATSKSFSMTMEQIVQHINNLDNKSLLSNDMKDIFRTIGWISDSSLDINNTVFQADLSELLMCILIDKLGISRTLISNACFKTAAGSAVHGSDNLFYDYDNKILYLGESKFYEHLGNGLSDAEDSLNAHYKEKYDISFARSHTSNFVAESGDLRTKIVEEFETIPADEYKLSSITFVMEEDKYLKKDIEDVLLRHRGFDSSNPPFANCFIVVFPILDKEDFLKRFIERLNDFNV